MGGREVWLYELARKLPREKYDIHFFTLATHREEKTTVKISPEMSQRIIPITTMLTLLLKNKYSSKLRGLPIIRYLMLLDFYVYSFMVKSRFLKEYNQDNAIFIAPNLGFECLPAVSLKRKKPSCVLVTLAMGEWLNDMAISYPSALKFLKKIELKTARASDIIVYQTHRQFEMENERLNIDKKKVRHLLLGGIDTSIFHLPDAGKKADFREKLGLKPDDFVLINVAVLRKLKGQEILIKALNRIQPQNGRIVLLLVGRGDTNYVKKLLDGVQTGITVRHLGWKSRDELAGILWASDVFVFPSLSEAVGIALLEAIACGLPVIASRVGGVPEIADGCGILVPPGDEAALAKALNEMHADIEKYRKMALSRRGDIVSGYSIDRSIDDFIKILDEM